MTFLRSRREVVAGLLGASALGSVPIAAREGGSLLGEGVRRTSTPIRLGSNENPTGLCPAARQAYLAAIEEANRYPGGAGGMLAGAIAERHQVDSSWVYITPGSGELLRAATVAFTSPTRALVTAAPSFEAPARVAEMTGAPVRSVRVTEDGGLDLTAMAASAEGAGLFFLCNPNNPTGGHVTATAVAAFVAKVKAAAPDARVLVDEAYFDYVDDPAYASAVPLAIADRRVLVTRTFSKLFGMAGLRVGYAIAHPETLAALRPSGAGGIMTGGMCGASLAAAAAALADTAHVAAERTRNDAVRRFTRGRFEAAGYRVLPSSANFVMIDITRSAGAFAGLCRQQQIYVARPFPPLSTCVRVTIGTMSEMEEAVPAMLALLRAPASAQRQAAPEAWHPGSAC